MFKYVLCFATNTIFFPFENKMLLSGPNVICETINVLGATYANCDGRYKYTEDQVDWAPERPVYKHVTKDRYIFWNAGGLGWSIGKKAYLTSGSHWHRSKSHLLHLDEILSKATDIMGRPTMTRYYKYKNLNCLFQVV